MRDYDAMEVNMNTLQSVREKLAAGLAAVEVALGQYPELTNLLYEAKENMQEALDMLPDPDEEEES